MSAGAASLWLGLAIGLPLVGCPAVAMAGKRLGPRVGWLALAFPGISLVSLLALAVGTGVAGQRIVEWPWIPSLGINLSWLVDGLSLFFGLVVAGMGCLIFFYAAHYLDDHYEHHGRFYCYLTLFMGAMLGTVFANNLMLLFVFWELTGLASFLLIGFLHGETDARIGARQALLVTALTGLALLAGLVLLYTVTGTYRFSDWAGSGLPFGEHRGLLTAALVLITVGAFGKSAQFPVHFWLPNAMAAPTPVSAYLHSATMVKLGVFLCARFFPLFAGHDLWAPLMSVIPFTTMLLAAVLALLSHDLKAILAFSTCSQLGYLIGYYGLGPLPGVEHDYLHILNHVAYKGGLFMTVGIVAHAAGIRDIRQLGGLFRRLPLMGTATLILAGSMAGLPGTTGFLSKEMMLKEIFQAMAARPTLGAFAAGCVVLTSMVKVAFSVRLFVNIFLGRPSDAVSNHFHAPSPGLQLPPVLLAGATLLFGLAPGLLDKPFQWLTVAGLNQPQPLALWHGFSPELLVSTLVLAGGGLLYWVGERTAWRWHEIPRALQFDRFFEASLERFSQFTKGLTRALRADQPVDYLPILLGFTVLVVGGSLVGALAAGPASGGPGSAVAAAAPDALRGFVAGLIALAVIGVVLLKRWTTQLISLSVAGFLICFYFVLYRAPDLALTQILIEVVTLFLIVILLGRFPQSAELGELTHTPPRWRKLTNLALALGVGGLASGLIWVVTAAPHQERLGRFFLAQTQSLAAGDNAVNTILVDFRGFDTLGEITVLVVAMLGALGLLMRYKRTPREYQQGPMGPPGFGIEETPHRNR